MQGRFTFDNALRNFGSLECTMLQCMVSSTKDHTSSAAVINMHSAQTTMRITVIHIMYHLHFGGSFGTTLILLVFSQRLTKDQIHVLVFHASMPTACQVVSLPVGETAPWTSGHIRPNPDGLQPVSSFVWLSFEGGGLGNFRARGRLALVLVVPPMRCLAFAPIVEI